MSEIQSRSRNTIRNAAVGISSQVILLVMSFINRTIFIQSLGVDYLAINSLYTNIIVILSLAELGIGNVLLYSLYKPLAEKDYVTINSLLHYYKVIYRKIAAAVLLIGLIFVPFIAFVVESTISYDKLIVYYLLFLLNSVCSYFVVYKTTLINADQKNYIIKIISTIVVVLKDIAQIVLLLTTGNFLLYLSVLVINTLLTNLILSAITNRMYPFVKNRERKAVDVLLVKKNIISASLYRLGNIIMNNTDNILISIILGTVYVGYYANYVLLISAIVAFISVFIQSIFSSIGNLNASQSKERSHELFNVLLILFHWIAAFCALCFLFVIDDFIVIWIGEQYLLDKHVLIVIVLNFYIQNIINPVWIYRETIGLFNQIRYVMLTAALINVLLSTLLGLYFGLAGVIAATAIARILTTFWYEPRLLYRLQFQIPVKQYWLRQTKYLLITMGSALVCAEVIHYVPFIQSNFLLKIVLCFVVVTLGFITFTFRSHEYNQLLGYTMIILRKLKKE